MPRTSKKDPFKKLDPQLKSTLDNMSEAELRAKASEVGLYRQARQEIMEQDPAVKQAREALANETRDYKDEIKGASVQMRYIKQRLEGMGKL